MGLTLNPKDFTFSGRSLNITAEKNKLLEPFGKQLWNYGFVLSLLPSKEQAESLNQQIGNARFIANKYLEARINAYQDDKHTLTSSEFKKDYLLKLKEEYSFLQKSDKFALESALDHIDNAYNNFFSKRAGFPKYVSRFKPNGNSYTTKYTNGNIELLVINGIPYIKLPKVGKIQFVMPKGYNLDLLKPEFTKITSACVKKQGNQYTVSIQMETVIDKIIPIKMIYSKNVFAIDMGIKHFGVYGNALFSEEIENPRFISHNLKKLRRLQQSLSRKVFNKVKHCGSKNYRKIKYKVATLHHKIKNQRKDFHHKLSRKITENCDAFICEDLNIKGMVKNHKLSKEIASCGWGQFLNFVKYKIERKGGYFIKVDRFFTSSQLCNHCGYKNPKVKDLRIREWICPVCGTYHNRDINAKDNLLTEGIRILRELNVAVV